MCQANIKTINPCYWINGELRTPSGWCSNASSRDHVSPRKRVSNDAMQAPTPFFRGKR